MFSSVFSMVCLMIIPAAIFIYTVNFGRWMNRRKEIMGSVTAYILASVSFVATGIALWRILA